jgi:hypothetical protein
MLPGLNSSYPKAAEADNAGTEERGRVKIIESCRQRNHEITTGQCEFGVAAVNGVAGEGGRVAEVLTIPDAVPAGSVRAADPGDAHASAEWKSWRVSVCDFPDDLVTRYQWLPPRRQFTFDNMQISPANATSPDPYQNVTGSGFRLECLSDFEWAKRDASG